ncbi:glycosyltransferase [Lichenifustis flavocetrariae]|uniref:Glycosyltransferase n=1 Tax=Lichenifustis flavocetrariae TaxID=2949735 RepID=A0AA42CJW1_9HYPH|nr:glycosyltransferase [Lichenifustis flavocetrariae]MCW6509963.1 glycosyltransferase [Lichenifustis flavocetrariae]
MRSCVIIVENLPVPLDRRVWQEAKALRTAGWKVSVICPATEKYPARFERIDDISIYRHPLYMEADGWKGFLAEYSSALFHEFRLLIKVWRHEGFDVIQACNPPDLIFLVALPFKLLGKRFVFDHHDVAPELFVAKFNRKGPLHAVLRLMEWLTFKSADLVISANGTFRDIAITRGGKKPDDVVAVYGVPDRSHIRRVEPDPAVRNGRSIVIGYIGIIGEQDGVDHMVKALHLLKTTYGQTDFQGLIIGDGPALPRVKTLADELGIAESITFTGYLSGESLLRHLSAIEIGIIPDPVNPYNDKISMNKVFEYSALGIPSVGYPLTETQRLLKDGAVFADSPEPDGLARACLGLMVDADKRDRVGRAAKKISDSSFNWGREVSKYLGVYDRLVPPTLALSGAPASGDRPAGG